MTEQPLAPKTMEFRVIRDGVDITDQVTIETREVAGVIVSHVQCPACKGFYRAPGNVLPEHARGGFRCAGSSVMIAGG